LQQGCAAFVIDREAADVEVTGATPIAQAFALKRGSEWGGEGADDDLASLKGRHESGVFISGESVLFGHQHMRSYQT
jgi:hypothetical protein